MVISPNPVGEGTIPSAMDLQDSVPANSTSVACRRRLPTVHLPSMIHPSVRLRNEPILRKTIPRNHYRMRLWTNRNGRPRSGSSGMTRLVSYHLAKTTPNMGSAAPGERYADVMIRLLPTAEDPSPSLTIQGTLVVGLLRYCFVGRGPITRAAAGWRT